MKHIAQQLFDKYSGKDHIRNFLLGFIDLEKHMERDKLTKEILLDIWNENIYNKDSGRNMYPNHEEWMKSRIESFVANMVPNDAKPEFENLIESYKNWLQQ